MQGAPGADQPAPPPPAGGFGAFGKMPALGDFFRLRVAQEFVAVWDGWLQAALLSSRQLLGERYDDCYMTAPVWRFVLPPGLAGGQGVMGVLMPSVDRVGRQFPLTLVGPCGSGAPLHELALQGAVLEALEGLALSALGDDMTRDALNAALDALSPVAPVPAAHSFPAAGGQVLTGAAPATAMADLALGVGLAHLSHAAVWSTVVDGQARIGLWPDLPTGADAAALFDMDAALWSGPAQDFDRLSDLDPLDFGDDGALGEAAAAASPAEPLLDVLDEIGNGPVG